MQQKHKRNRGGRTIIFCRREQRFGFSFAYALAENTGKWEDGMKTKLVYLA